MLVAACPGTALRLAINRRFQIRKPAPLCRLPVDEFAGIPLTPELTLDFFGMEFRNAPCLPQNSESQPNTFNWGECGVLNQSRMGGRMQAGGRAQKHRRQRSPAPPGARAAIARLRAAGEDSSWFNRLLAHPISPAPPLAPPQSLKSALPVEHPRFRSAPPQTSAPVGNPPR